MSNAFSDKLPIEKPQDCMSRVISGTTSSFVAGGIIGALAANWGDIPQVLQDKPLPALKRTGAIMGSYGLTFAAIGLAYSGIDCVAETFRGKKDIWNGVFGGAAAGAMLGLRLGKLPVGVGAAAALAFTSAIVDTTGGHLKAGELFNDHQTPVRAIYPYPLRPYQAEEEE
ncbi:hypothetical protein WJX77_002223 [Trebouxia sp. C0004]